MDPWTHHTEGSPSQAGPEPRHGWHTMERVLMVAPGGRAVSTGIVGRKYTERPPASLLAHRMSCLFSLGSLTG